MDRTPPDPATRKTSPCPMVTDCKRSLPRICSGISTFSCPGRASDPGRNPEPQCSTYKRSARIVGFRHHRGDLRPPVPPAPISVFCIGSGSLDFLSLSPTHEFGRLWSKTHTGILQTARSPRSSKPGRHRLAPDSILTPVLNRRLNRAVCSRQSGKLPDLLAQVILCTHPRLRHG